MPSLAIDGYKVGTNRQKSASNYHRRYLVLNPSPGQSGDIQNIVIYFFVQERIANDPDIGYQTPNTNHYVVGFAPISDFADMYNILQTEKPLTFNWAADASDKLHWFGLTTNNEPIGEGPDDGA